MKGSLYEEIRGFLVGVGDGEEDEEERMSKAMAKYPQVPYDTFISIRSQERSRHLRLNHHKLRNPHAIHQYISRYVKGDDILDIGSDYNVSPCLLMRILLEHLFGLSKQQITQCLKDPFSLPEDHIDKICQEIRQNNFNVLGKSGNGSHNQHIGGNLACNFEESSYHVSSIKLQNELFKCLENDSISSPYIEMIRHVTGLEYEAYLSKRLKSYGIGFQTEDALRSAGFSKTPDIKLDVPVAVCGRLVNWIDSKASFGDEHSHRVQSEQQYQRYVNRFGPGMVIYWFGFIDELDDHPDILLLHDFPSKDQIYCLPSLPIITRP